MTIDWTAFVIVVTVSLGAACLLVTLFSLALRLGDADEEGEVAAAWRRPVSVALYALCGLAVVAGIVLIVPALHLWN